MWDTWVSSFALLAVLLNPFLMAIYLIDLVRDLEHATFRRVMIRSSLIAGVVFCLFAVGGDAIFSDILQARFAAFLLFGGLVFLLASIRIVFTGTRALSEMRGEPAQVSGEVVLPFMIGPGTVSASILAGHQKIHLAFLAIAAALVTCVVGLFILKAVHDYVRTRNEPLVERYIETVGRITGLVVGTISVEMILRGAELWLHLDNGA